MGTSGRDPAHATTPPPVHLAVQLTLPDKPPREFSYDFRQAVISLGRDPGNDIQIPLTTVSRRHARIFFERGDYFLEDLGSTHGTNHNGQRLQRGEKRLLRDGDELSVMSFAIKFKTTAGTSLDRQPGERTEQLARRMVQEVLSSLDGHTEPPSIRLMNGPDEGRRLVIGDDMAEIILGRSPECDLTLDDQNVSRRHCLIKRNWHGFTAQDLGSKNGVLVNGTRIEGAQMIKDGDELQVGGIKMVFFDPPSRLLDQMGGLGNQTMDPDGVGETGGEAEPEEAGYDDEPDAEEEAHGGYDDDDDEEREEEPPSSVEIEPPGGDELEGFEAPSPEELEAMKQLAQATKKGIAWDVIILVAGGVFLAAAVSLVLFMVL